MRATVNSIDFYSSLSTAVLDTENSRGSVTVQAADEFDNTQNCEAVEIELTKNVWAVWDYEALPYRTSTNFNTRTNDEYTTKPHIAYT